MRDLIQNPELKTQHLRSALPLLLVMAVLVVIYAPTLQAIPNGSSHPYMVDAGEMQIALNVWGTLHPTGYPLYTLLASTLTNLQTALGGSPALAPSIASLGFALIALSLLYALLLRLTARPWLAAAALLLLGLTRSWWVHSAIAEIYSFSMILLIALLALALWPADWPARRRVWLLAVVGGVAVFHHRILALTAPALLLAVWPVLWADRRRLVGTLAGALPLGLLGGLQYLYLPLRDWAGGEWVYGRPGTWQGFREVFSGFEYNYLLADRPDAINDFFQNLSRAVEILAAELSAPGLLLAAAALLALVIFPNKHRRTALVLLAAGVPFVLWVGVLYRSVLPEAVLMPAVVCLVAGVALAGDVVIERVESRAAPWAIVAVLAAWVLLLLPAHGPFVESLTGDENGLRMIELAERIPREDNPAFVVPWGADHFPIVFGQKLLGRNTDLLLVDHTADFQQLIAEGRPVITRPVTFFVFILEFWAEWYGVDEVYVYSYTPELVEVRAEPVIVQNPGEPLNTVTDAILVQEAALRCDDDSIVVDITWTALDSPDRDLSVFVHLTGESRDDLVAEPGGGANPAGGFRYTSTWLPGEQVRDLYRLPRVDTARAVVFGMYAQAADGSFTNYGETTLELADYAGCAE